MANMPFGIGSLPSATSSFGAGGGSLLGNIAWPAGAYDSFAGLPLASMLSYSPGSAMLAGAQVQPNNYGQLGTGALMQPFGVVNPVNSVTLMDSMKSPPRKFASSLGGGGLPGNPGGIAGGLLAAPAAPNGASAANVPMPRSGGKGMMGRLDNTTLDLEQAKR